MCLARLKRAPDVTADEGYYSLYWVVPGSPPTFLQITGEVGGTIPDYSKHDRNNQLVQNAEVQGQPAYHDLTPDLRPRLLAGRIGRRIRSKVRT